MDIIIFSAKEGRVRQVNLGGPTGVLLTLLAFLVITGAFYVGLRMGVEDWLHRQQVRAASHSTFQARPAQRATATGEKESPVVVPSDVAVKAAAKPPIDRPAGSGRSAVADVPPAQAQGRKSDFWIETGWNLVLGVLSSLLASAIVYIWAAMRSRRISAVEARHLAGLARVTSVSRDGYRPPRPPPEEDGAPPRRVVGASRR